MEQSIFFSIAKIVYKTETHHFYAIDRVLILFIAVNGYIDPRLLYFVSWTSAHRKMHAHALADSDTKAKQKKNSYT